MPFDRSKPVLVVDDNFAIIRIVKALLNAQGVLDVEGAGSGPEAIRKLSQKAFGLVISDFFMMPMNGIDSPSVKSAIVMRVRLGRPAVLALRGWREATAACSIMTGLPLGGTGLPIGRDCGGR